tara:strand:+ start:332 stop:589 length:258 start_codon:yes stop_codon:yes gene_type:complete
MANTHLVVRKLRVNNETKAYPIFEGSKPFARTYRQGWVDAYKEFFGRYPEIDRGGKIVLAEIPDANIRKARNGKSKSKKAKRTMP